MRIHYFQHVPYEGLGCIGHWVRENDYELTVTHWDDTVEIPDLTDIDMLIIMGGPMSVYESARYPWLNVEKKLIGRAIDQGKIVLGICFGAQLIAATLGAAVIPNPQKEIGWFPVSFNHVAAHTPLLEFLPPTLEVFHWHGDTFELPEGASRFGSSAACKNQAFMYGDRVIGLQFHLEMTATGVDEMLVHGEHEILPAPYIQSIPTIESKINAVGRINEYMYQLLDKLADIKS
ncbi:GMP synthase (glutamine-hydrolysing) [Chitinophaga skermanii]|uniref:GMP synthase (Glutamine-hydrolysing) n=1 Tax=Chitinophaga skermanii TaxID=331697 RepID=A0A327Q804_9BACT|nr:type 1 glutamine amidotransferase [Chitinophaga skermanii]RAI99382.1 GMP synthase (glutamine-hydrolysing) [Chitinophaga skermanii]